MAVNKIHYNPNLDRLRIDLDQQKIKFQEAKDNYLGVYANAIRFNSGHIENDPQVANYNSHIRKANNCFPDNKHRVYKQPIANTSYDFKLNGDIFELGKIRSKSKSSVSLYPSNKSQQILKKLNANTYKAANGTVYRHWEDDKYFYREVDYPTENVIHIPGKYHEKYRMTVTLDEVPQNIKAKFGSKDTEKLLNDQLKVHDTITSLQNAGIIKKRDIAKENEVKAKREQAEIAKSQVEAKKVEIKDYYDLGNHLRFSIQHGYPEAVTKSLKESVHNWDVNKEFFSDAKNIESPYRRKKDWLSNWVEQNVIRERIITGLAKANQEKTKSSKE